jgi:hypothetical protein
MGGGGATTNPSQWLFLSTYYLLRPPEGTFDPPISITLNYSDSQVPPGVLETDLFLADHFGRKLETRIDATANQAHASISTFYGFGLFGQAFKPTVLISEPLPLAVIDDQTAGIRVQVSGIDLSAYTGPNVSGQGQLIYYLDVAIPTAKGHSAVTGVGTCRIAGSKT